MFWSSDGKWLLVNEGARVFRRDLDTGARSLWKELVPADPAGIFGIHPVFARDAKSYAYTYDRWISNLYVVKGLK